MNTAQYFKRYFELLKDAQNGNDAFTKLENEYFKKCKKHKYASYGSFKRMKSYYFGVY